MFGCNLLRWLSSIGLVLSAPRIRGTCLISCQWVSIPDFEFDKIFNDIIMQSASVRCANIGFGSFSGTYNCSLASPSRFPASSSSPSSTKPIPTIGRNPFVLLSICLRMFTPLIGLDLESISMTLCGHSFGVLMKVEFVFVWFCYDHGAAAS